MSPTPRKPRTPAAVLGLLTLLLTSAGTALAQPAQTNPGNKPATSPPAGTAKPAYAPDAKAGPLLLQEHPREHQLTVRVRVDSDSIDQLRTVRDAKGRSRGHVPEITPFEFTGFSFIFPYVLSTSSSHLLGETKPWPDNEQGVDGYKGRLRVDGRIVDDTPDILRGYPAGTRLGKWTYVKSEQLPHRDVTLELVLPVRCHRTRFDEAAAMRVPWPSRWPRDAGTALSPQLYVEKGIDDAGSIRAYDAKPVEQAVKAYLAEEGIKSPQATPLVRVAKVLAAKVQRDVQPSRDGLVFQSRTNRLSGVELQAPSVTLSRGQGSEHDRTVLLAALYKAAGIPARTVIAVDASRSDSDLGVTLEEEKQLVSYVEFAVFDEAARTINWIPVDLTRLDAGRRKNPDIEQPWEFFGTHDKLDGVIPFALHFHPPTDVSSYGEPLFWGWFCIPETPANALKSITFSVGGVAKRNQTPLPLASPREIEAPKELEESQAPPQPDPSDKGRSNK
jgi:transglutaminase-like putative cysteine protease